MGVGNSGEKGEQRIIIRVVGRATQKGKEWSSYSLECALGSPCKEFPIVGNPKPTIQIGCEPKNGLSPLTIFLVRIIGAVCGNLLRICGSAEMLTGEMSKSQARRYAENGSRRSFRGSTWWERRQKMREDRDYEQAEGQSSLGEGSFQTY